MIKIITSKLHRRGTAIVENNQGILLVAGKNKEFMLPGGQARSRETRSQTAMRELREETGLKSQYATPLFEYQGKYNAHTVIKVKSYGKLRPRNEIKYVAWYNDKVQDNIKIAHSSQEIIKKYLEWKKENSSSFKRIKNYFLLPQIRFDKPRWKRCDPPTWVKRKLVSSGARIKGKHYEYKLYIWVGNQQGETDWKYYRKEIL